MRTMYDGITPAAVPPGGDLYAGYVDGTWPSYAGLVARYPKARHVPIATSATTNNGLVLDTEPGDATPEQAVNWVLMRRHAGVVPSVYCGEARWPLVRAAFQTHDVPEPPYWVAHYITGDTAPAIPAGAVAIQWKNSAGYDESAVADYWPGVDPAPIHPADAPAITEEDDEMSTTSNAGRAGLSWSAGSRHVVQVTCDPGAAQNKPFSLRGVLVFPKTTGTPGPFVFQLTVDEGGSGVYQIPVNLRANCRGVILEGAAAGPVYDAVAV